MSRFERLVDAIEKGMAVAYIVVIGGSLISWAVYHLVLMGT